MIVRRLGLAFEYYQKYFKDPKEIYWFAFEKWGKTAERLLKKAKILTNYPE